MSHIIDTLLRGMHARRRQIAFLCAVVGLLLLLQVLVENAILFRISSTLRKNHGDNYVVLIYHVEGNDTMRMSAYAEAWLLLCRHVYVDPSPERFNGWPQHVAILASDNKWIYAYHWSFRHFRLELDFQEAIAGIAPEQRDYYKLRPAEVERKHGINRLNHPVDEAVNFYYHGP